MKRQFSSKLTALMACALAIPAFAVAQVPDPALKKVKLETLKPGPIILEPDMGYILVRLGPKATEADHPIPVAFNRIPSDGSASFPDSVTKEKNFARTVSVVLNPSRSFGDKDGVGTYILKVYPGRWILNNVAGTCLSLGTYAVDIKAGDVIDFGTVLTAREDGKSTVPELSKSVLSPDLAHFGVVMNIVMSEAVYVKPPVVGAVFAADFANLPIKPAALIVDYRSDNRCRGLINRAVSLPPLGHQSPMTKDEATAHVAKQLADQEAAKHKK
jgi:hypothetical protein